MGTLPFSQIDVFSSHGLLGNPLAVVHDADDLPDEDLAAFARWTNLSETTFLLRPTDPRADYRVRIFTTGGELPFAGHPTLGSAHAWLEEGGAPRHTDCRSRSWGWPGSTTGRAISVSHTRDSWSVSPDQQLPHLEQLPNIVLLY